MERKKHIIRDNGSKPGYVLRNEIEGAVSRGQEVVVVQGIDARPTYVNRDLKAAGAEIVQARSTEQADRVFQRLVSEQHERF